MLGKIYQRIAENVSKTANRLYPQRPHNIVPIKDWQPWGALIRINTKVMKAVSKAPSACWRSRYALIGQGKRLHDKVAKHLRRKGVNGN